MSIPRVRMAPPPGKPWNTVYVTGTSNVNIKLAAGWTIIEAHGEATVEAKANGASTDIPEQIAVRIEQVLGEKPRKKRKRIGEP